MCKMASGILQLRCSHCHSGSELESVIEEPYSMPPFLVVVLSGVFSDDI